MVDKLYPLLLSIIIPAHNEEFRLPDSLAKIDAFLQQQSYAYDVIVVENGSADNTVGVVQDYAAEHPYLRLMMVDTRGKGLATFAMPHQRGTYSRGFSQLVERVPANSDLLSGR